MKKYILNKKSRIDQKKIDKLKKYDVATIYEAQGKIGLINDQIKPIDRNQFVCGSAVTVECFAGDNLMIHAAIEVCKPNDVLVITTIGESKHGMIGELIIKALIERKVQGVVIDAGVRDVAEIRELGFPIWSRAIHSQGTTKSRGGWVNSSVICGGEKINPGDIIMADDDGVVRISKEDIDEVNELANARMEKEEKTKEKIKNQELSLDFYNLRKVLEEEQVIYYEE